ncbi:hypothetical protein PCANC_28086 [Puccinia coronata f. sp. avenae]|uniref:Uncharacterized protein n=1 Tax=Puccinia coronata f. sp. avenae TaxID=200324 RepID=A0A2N5S2C3_9BASI|nr:hypothetical protein PCANC_28086 [Puccinia coronata f. sp. avenae]
MHGSQPPPYNANYPAGCRMSTDPVRHRTRPGIRPGTPGYAGSGSYPYKPDWTLRSAEVPSFMGSAAFRQRRGATSGLAWDLRGTPVGALLGSPS